MWLLGLLLLGLAASGLSGLSFGDDDEGEPIERDGEEGRLVEGDRGANLMSGTGGPDILSGEGGNDVLSGGNGDDALFGGAGNDVLNGGSGEDYMTGGTGDDLINGGSEDDILMGYQGDDTLNGGDGDDLLAGVDVLNRDPEVADVLASRPIPFPLEAEAPTEEEANVLDGGAGDDQLILGEGDIATGGTGEDEFSIGYWVEDNAPVITDFDNTEDVISIMLEPHQPDPIVTIERSGGETHVLANDVVLARITGDAVGLQVSDVILTSI